MKTKSSFKRPFSGAALLLVVIVAVFFFSCEKNTLDSSGQFNIKVVNASATAGPQSFTLAGSVLVSGGLNFTEASAYINTASGKRLVTEFKNAGTNSVYASGEIWTTNGVNFTVFLAGKGSSARVKNFQDDLALPNNGQAKIKFIHLSDKAPSDINIKDASGDDLVGHISLNTESGYKYVSPGTLSVQLRNFATKKDLGNFDITDLQAGKIYTLYFVDDANGNLVMNKVLYN